jgi:hypothetical protein
METKRMLKAVLVLALVLVVCQSSPAGAAPMGTAFTIQGLLMDGNEPANGFMTSSLTSTIHQPWEP